MRRGGEGGLMGDLIGGGEEGVLYEFCSMEDLIDDVEILGGRGYEGLVLIGGLRFLGDELDLFYDYPYCQSGHHGQQMQESYSSCLVENVKR